MMIKQHLWQATATIVTSVTLTMTTTSVILHLITASVILHLTTASVILHLTTAQAPTTATTAQAPTTTTMTTVIITPPVQVVLVSSFCSSSSPFAVPESWSAVSAKETESKQRQLKQLKGYRRRDMKTRGTRPNHMGRHPCTT